MIYLRSRGRVFGIRGGRAEGWTGGSGAWTTLEVFGDPPPDDGLAFSFPHWYQSVGEKEAWKEGNAMENWATGERVGDRVFQHWN